MFVLVDPVESISSAMENSFKPIRSQLVAVGIILDSDNRILIAKRPPHKIKGGFWEFPGGKIEVHESPEEALIRELQEEVGIKPLILHKLMQYSFDYSDYKTLLEVFIVSKFEGVPIPIEQQEIQWVKENELMNFNFLEANIKMIEVLKGWLKKAGS